MSLKVVSSSPGRVVLAWFSALCTALTQDEVDSSTQVAITLANPTSLPPMVIVTKVLLALSPPSWPLMTSLVVAPEQVALVKLPPCSPGQWRQRFFFGGSTVN
jgi:hypothetical protein